MLLIFTNVNTHISFVWKGQIWKFDLKKKKQPLRGVLENTSSITCNFSNNTYEEVQIYRPKPATLLKIIFCKGFFRNFCYKFHIVNFRKTIFKNTFSRIPAVASSKMYCVKSVQIWSFFWSVFSRIRNEYREIRIISPYSVRMRENTDQKKTPYLDTFHAVMIRLTREASMKFFIQFSSEVDIQKNLEVYLIFNLCSSVSK